MKESSLWPVCPFSHEPLYTQVLSPYTDMSLSMTFCYVRDFLTTTIIFFFKCSPLHCCSSLSFPLFYPFDLMYVLSLTLWEVITIIPIESDNHCGQKQSV